MDNAYVIDTHGLTKDLQGRECALRPGRHAAQCAHSPTHREGAQTANVRLEFGAGNLSPTALDASDSAVSRMSFEGPPSLRPEASYQVAPTSTSAPGSAAVPSTRRFQPLGNERYRSVNYATAANRVQMRLEVGIGDVSVR